MTATLFEDLAPTPKKTKAQEKEEAMEGFESFWTLYPRKQKKPDAKKAWLQTKDDRPGIRTLLDALEKWRRGEMWGNGFVHLAGTWLRQHMWNDDPNGGRRRRAGDPGASEFTNKNLENLRRRSG